MEKVIFFSGAGASVGAGLPTMSDLLTGFANSSNSHLVEAMFDAARGDLELFVELLSLLEENDGIVDRYNQFLIGMSERNESFPLAVANPSAFHNASNFTYSQWDKVKIEAMESK